tara:strand:- start:2455 stop:2829 length:375 start_codon:yes stop_codon:yes gene_type:complete
MVVKFIKFIIVGFSGLIIDFSITFLCKEKINLDRYVSNSIGFILAAGSNYIFNRIWTFGSNNPEIAIEFSSFVFVSIIGLIINNSILWLLHNRGDLHFYLAKFGAIMVTTFWNFFANYFYTFNI